MVRDQKTLRGVASADHYPLATDILDLSCSASKWQQGDVPRLLDGQAEAALVRRADAGQTAWHDLAALSNELRQQANVLVVDRVDLLDTEFANLLSAEKLPATGFPTASASRSTFTISGLGTGIRR